MSTTGRGSDGLDLVARVARAYRMAGGDDCPLTDEGEETDHRNEVIGPWRLLDRIGRGGMGEVYRAERCDGAYQAMVAVKLLRAGIDAVELARRFDRERQILARLEHPGIARLIDGGRSAQGLPYLVMELVDGQSLISHARDNGLDLDARLRLFLAVCDAVAYAHRNLIVHRDLKPSNILVDGDGRVRLLDFGISKLLEDRGDEEAALTRTELTPMTIAYAAPEQILGQPVTTATDVYALGVLLYELMTGRRPHRREGRSLPTLAGAVDSEEATRPSDAVARDQAPDTAPSDRRLPRLLRGDLDTIALTALRRQPDRRYASAAAMAEDLRRYLEDQPIRARPDSARYRIGKFIHRHRFGVAALILVLLALSTGLTAALWQAREAREQARRAEAVQGFLLDIFRTNTSRQPDPVKARETTARELLDIGAEGIGDSLNDAPGAKFAVLSLLGELYHDLAIDDEAVRLREQAVELARVLHGAQSLQTAKSLIDLAASLHASRHVSARAAVLEEASEIIERRRDAPAELRAELLRKRAEHYSSSDIPRSLEYATEAVSILETLPWSVQLAEAHYVMGLAHHFGGQTGYAAEAFTRAIEVSRQVQGVPNPSLPRFYALLSDAQYRQLEIDGARESARLALAMAIQISGPEHVDTLQTTMRLGRLLFDTGSTQEGLEHLARARDMALATRGPDDPFHTPQALNEHGFALARLGHLEAGLADIQAAIDNRRHNRPGTLYLAQMLERAVFALMRLGRHGDALALLDEAGQIRDAAGQSRGSAARNDHVVLRAYLAAAEGRNDEARQWLSEYTMPVDSVELRPGMSLDQIELVVVSAELALLMNEFVDASEKAAQALAAVSALGMNEYLVLQRARVLHVQGSALFGTGDRDAGCRSLREALMIREDHLFAGSPQLAETRTAAAPCR